jgi:cell shape-determining protein MreC
MITDSMTPIQKCIEWMRTGGKTARSVLFHQKIAKQATAQLQELEQDASQRKASEDANKELAEENSQLRKQMLKNTELLNQTTQLLEKSKK